MKFWRWRQQTAESPAIWAFPSVLRMCRQQITTLIQSVSKQSAATDNTRQKFKFCGPSDMKRDRLAEFSLAAEKFVNVFESLL